MVLLPVWGVKSAPFACDRSAKIDTQQRGFVFSGQQVTPLEPPRRVRLAQHVVLDTVADKRSASALTSSSHAPVRGPAAALSGPLGRPVGTRGPYLSVSRRSLSARASD